MCSREYNIPQAQLDAIEFNAMLDEEREVREGMAHMGDDPLDDTEEDYP